ncbi:MAG: ATP-binding cassette domain-containing protein [Candidatus Galacturonibacter soehngenii]|nr:ATP-binding cassette domain-containing protein [Candidatus Galacturonibacter soehngenii]
MSPGSKTAIIGENGSGKSTIIKILSGLYDVNQGEVLLNKVNIKKLSLSSYREIFSVVSQQIYLFDDTIKNNICLYKEVSEQKIKQALKDSRLEEFINKVSMDYRVGQNGAMLSGGQKQKVALARAFIQDRPILIFDEATSSSDSNSEYEIIQLLLTKMENKTIIIITHRTEILQGMDYVFYLENGEATQIDSYKNLIT